MAASSSGSRDSTREWNVLLLEGLPKTGHGRVSMGQVWSRSISRKLNVTVLRDLESAVASRYDRIEMDAPTAGWSKPRSCPPKTITFAGADTMKAGAVGNGTLLGAVGNGTLLMLCIAKQPRLEGEWLLGWLPATCK
jgi:hypothetical protein